MDRQKRYDDCFLLDTTKFRWTIPDVTGQIPAPRANHTATLAGDKLYIIGGYGGTGYSRVMFNDVHVMDTNTFEFTKLAVTGTVPDPRANHVTVCVRESLYVLGGRSFTDVYEDLYIFDLEENKWTKDASVTSAEPCYNHTGIACMAVPTWKAFFFGGRHGTYDQDQDTRKYSDQITVLDADKMTWLQPSIAGEAPPAREDSIMVYDSKNSRMVMIGGWADQMYNDVHTLDVSMIVGPPYAISGLSPIIGPVDGGTELIITGMGFEDAPCTVRFSFGKGEDTFADSSGEYVSPTEIKVITPDFEEFGPKKVDVRLSMKGDAMTTTKTSYQFFENTKAENCVVYGPGTNKECSTVAPVAIVIQAVDGAGAMRSSGLDTFDVEVVNQKDGSEIPKEEIAIQDNDDGTYLITFKADNPGTHRVDILYKENALFGSPFEVEFKEDLPADVNEVNGAPMLEQLTQDIAEMVTFTSETATGLDEPVATGEPEPLLRVMGHLFNVKERSAEIEMKINRYRELIKYLNKYHKINKNADLTKLESANDVYKDIQKMLPDVRAKIANPFKVASANTKEEVAKFTLDCKKYRQMFKDNSFFKFETGPEASYTAIDASEEDIKGLFTDAAALRDVCRVYEFPEIMEEASQQVDDCQSDLGSMRRAWANAEKIASTFETFNGTLWSDVKADEMEEEAKALQKSTRGLDRAVRWCEAYKQQEQTVKNMLVSLPLVGDLRHPSMRDRHWAELKRVTEKDFDQEAPDFTLAGLLELGLHMFADDVGEIVDQAQKEQKMEQTLKTLDETWSGMEMLYDQHKDTDLQIFRMDGEDFETLEDNQLVVQSMMASKYLATFETEIRGWQKTLNTVADVVTIGAECVRAWSYLENLFIYSEEVKRELPEDAKRFAGLHEEMIGILKYGASETNVVKMCNKEGLFAQFEKIQEGLTLCEKALAEYLDAKKRMFPRFYFTSTVDLLDILSNGNEPLKIMTHMPKVICGIAKLITTGGEGGGDDRPTASAMVAAVGKEDVDFHTPLKLMAKVESYLQDVIDAMQNTLQQAAVLSVKSVVTKPRRDWMYEDPAQITIAVNQIQWVIGVEKALDELLAGGGPDGSALVDYSKEQIDGLSELISITRTELTKPQRTLVMVLITMDTHNRDVIRNYLLKQGVYDKDNFLWASQLRPKWVTEEEKILFSICDARVPYGYEYLGNGPRLVITPLTDRIYVTATQAQNLSLGCAPAGPAGTGKTESTKDLSSALAVPIYVFNCAPEMDYRSLGDIFKGLAASGAWGCFDEFNRLIPEVLSVCTVQYKAVTDAIRAGLKEFMLMGDMMTLIPSAMAFITMNPGYLGRSELPEGLKALFRPITVMVPDFGLICENMLMAEGFETAVVLGKRFFTLYDLCKRLLSKQMHYDWGLRAIKSVLVVAGGFKRAEPEMDEGGILMRALRDFNIPKIVSDDMTVFMGLLGDLFPGLDPPRKRDMDFEALVKKTTLDNDLHPDDEFILKSVQLGELMEIRHCVFVMGPAGCGKSKAWQILAQAKNEAQDKFTHLFPNQSTSGGGKITAKDVNPKSIETSELYGYVNMATREWKDGLLSSTMRDLGNDPDKNPKWILLDGDLDANWIESMNSVMDDNKILTLPSNERITLYPHMRLIFEIRDLKHATPATSSRAGILFISDGDGYQWRCMVKAWLSSRKEEDGYTPELKEELAGYFEKYIGPTLYQIKKEFFTIIPIVDVQAVEVMFHILAGLLTDDVIKGDLRELLETFIVFACVWAFGSPLFTKDNVNYRKEFSSWWKSEHKTVKFPSRGEVFDYFIDLEEKKFEPWTKIVPVLEFDSTTMEMSSITVPTPETVAVDFMCDILLPRRNPVMLVGEAGTGKTQQLMGKLRKMQEESDGDYVFASVVFNYYSDSFALQEILEQSLEKKAGINFGPKGKAKLIYFVDDLNMPQLDAYMTQTSISLMRTHFDYQHWYDRQKFTLKNIGNCQWVSAMNPSAGSSLVNPRLMRWYMVFAVEIPGGESLYAIYNTFLEGHLKPFPDECQKLVSNLIRGALTVQTQVMQTFRKTAVNFHYEFNIRHLSRVFTGLLGSRPEQFKDPDKFVRMWMHESERVYGDILVSYEHLGQYQKISQGVVKKLFPNVSIDRFYAKSNADPLVYSHFAGGDLTDKLYDEIQTYDQLSEILNGALKEYNEMNAVMDLVLFTDALKHICRVTRVINNTGGHALLVGVGGMGKQSLSRLSSFVCGYTTVQIQISQAYTITSSPGLKEDIRTMYTKSGLKEEGICFLFTDSQIADEKFLVYINDLLSSGDIPGLFAPDEMEGCINGVRSRVKAAGIPETTDNCWRFFIDSVRTNLHMCLCFSPVGGDMARRAQRFPALINNTCIDWFQDWPQSALLSVTQKFLAEVEGGLGDEETTENVIKFMPWSFELVNNVAREFKASEKRDVYTTPKSFLELLGFYKRMLESKRSETDAAINRLDTGLTKLLETSEAVAVMEEELKVKSVEVAEKKEKAEGIAEVVGKEKAIVDAQAAAAAVEGEKCDAIAKEAGEIQQSAETDLAKAEPAVREAEAALDTLDKKELGECKGMAKPPGGVDDVFAAVLVLLANSGGRKDIACNKKGMPKDLSWKAAQLLMKDVVGFIVQLKGVKDLIDTDQVPAVNFENIRPYLAMEHFNYEIIKKKSAAAAGCCMFVIAIVTYYDIVVTVEPKRQALREATEKLNKASAELEVINAEVADLQAKLKVLVDQFDEADNTKKAAIAESDLCAKKLGLAQRLVAALASEKVRWAESIEQLKTDYTVLTGDCLLAAAFVSYVGPFTKPFRTRLIEEEMAPFVQSNNIPLSEDADPLKVMVTASEIAEWGAEGLPADPVSVENGTILTRCTRYPVMIDPQLQGIAWIKERESKRNLQVTRLTAKDMIGVMERSIEGGHSVLIENMGETIEAVLANVVGRRLFKKGRSMYVQLGEKEVQFNDTFQLFMHTKLSNPHYPPEVQAEATVINFSVTENGLEDQLLALVVCKERPDLEQQKAKLISDQNGFLIKMKELEDDLLFRLANAEGDITEDVELIENLEESKRIATDIMEKQKVAAETEITINEARENYRPPAGRGALLFFLMVNLNKVHTFYQFSLNSYVAVFSRAIDLVSKPKKPKNPLLKLKMAVTRATKKFSWSVDVLKQARAGGDFGGGGVPVPKTKEELDERLKVLTESVQFTVVSYIRRGLFVVDKMTLATQVTLWVLRKEGELPADEVGILISGKQTNTGASMSQLLAEWLPESAWLGLQALKEIKAFEKLPDDMDSSPEMWKRWYDLEKPELVDMPKEYKSMDEWKKIMVLRVVRPDRVTPAMSQFIKDRMGGRYIDEEAFDMRACYNESGPSTPIFFVLFPGVDPTPDVEKLGDQLGFTEAKGNYVNISMGQGQEAPAEQGLDNFAKNGGWVFLQNIHLMAGWLPSLERKLEICAETGHDDFRCFLSAEQPMFAGMPAPMVKSIPEAILQSCIKVANEAPVDAKANLRMAYANFSEDKWGPCGDDQKKISDCKNVLFALCVFHTMLLGRKKFGFVGWSRVYPFNTGDLTISSDVMVAYIRDNAETPYADLRYIFGEIMYGGHITDPWDRRVDNNYLTVLVGEHTVEGFECMPGFPMPNPAETDYDGYCAHIEEKMPLEDPTMYGLHPNAGIGNLLTATSVLFDTIMTLSGGGGGGGGGAGMEAAVATMVEEYLEKLPENFNMFEIRSRVTEKSPYVLVVLQEIEMMNGLLSEIRRSLIELQLGLQGALNMSPGMETLMGCLFTAKIPPTWTKAAYASLKGLVAWWADMQDRVNQLTNWSDTLILPVSVWISGLFNANAFLTAINQTTSRREGLPLDTMDTLVDVTKVMDPNSQEGPVEDGALIHGCYMEGARWNSEEGCIADSFLKDLHPEMPLLHVFSQQAPALETRFIEQGYYECPVFSCTTRGASNTNAIFGASIKMKEGDKKEKWISAACCLLFSED